MERTSSFDYAQDKPELREKIAITKRCQAMCGEKALACARTTDTCPALARFYTELNEWDFKYADQIIALQGEQGRTLFNEEEIRKDAGERIWEWLEDSWICPNYQNDRKNVWFKVPIDEWVNRDNAPSEWQELKKLAEEK